jgi:RNA polymerase sigma-70 factor (ECF subfamily)
MRFIIKKLKSDPDTAEEIFAITIEAAWKGFRTFKSKSSFFTWICKIALNKIADYYRTQIHERSIVVGPFLDNLVHTDDDKLTPEENLALQELRISVRKCLDCLSPETRNFFLLRYWKQMTLKQIAKVTGVSERSIEGKLYRGKILIRKIIVSEYPHICKQYTPSRR